MLKVVWVNGYVLAKRKVIVTKIKRGVFLVKREREYRIFNVIVSPRGVRRTIANAE